MTSVEIDPFLTLIGDRGNRDCAAPQDMMIGTNDADLGMRCADVKALISAIQLTHQSEQSSAAGVSGFGVRAWRSIAERVPGSIGRDLIGAGFYNAATH